MPDIVVYNISYILCLFCTVCDLGRVNLFYKNLKYYYTIPQKKKLDIIIK